ncbi:MAG TPA: O-antigen ligase family protein [Pirellulaceae bacterium]|nr:O-antigen ligase family protein [Pirellulaceae bacterium]
MSKQRHQRKRQPGGASALPALVERFRPLLLPAAVALLIAPHLIPSEAVAAGGTYAVPAMLWCVLFLAWGIVTAFSAQPRIVFSWSDAALLLLVGWHTLSGLLPREGIVTRGTWNIVWLWISYGVGYFLLRQLLLSSVQTRALVAVMLGLAICLTSQAYYQYFVTMPAVRQELAKNPAQVLKENDIPLDPDSPVRRHFEDRVRAVEPLATFALTNSLAGFLAPWTVLAAGLALVLWQTGQHHPPWMTVRLVATALAVTVFCCGCLLLTKSRTALVAVLAGGILVGLFGRVGGWRFDWRLPAVVFVVLVLMGLLAVAVGGLDLQVLSEAPKSVLYRLEYWRSAAAMIGDFPLWGCGPGNFQDYYTRYKLPQASETVADPHNVFLEIWATAGTPALVTFLLWIGALVFDLSRRRDIEPTEPLLKDGGSARQNDIRRVYLGGLIGIALGFGLAFLTMYPLWTSASGGDIGILLIGLPLTALVLWQIHPWIENGSLGKTLPVIGLMTLLLNLCAAGAASFPGVVTSGLVLAAVALQQVEVRPLVWQVSRLWLPPLLLGPLALAAACLWTEYSPVLRSQAKMQDAQAAWERAVLGRGRMDEAIERLTEAAAADPANSDPWERLAPIYLERWLAAPSDESWQDFANAAEQCRRLRPARYQQHRQRGEWHLQAYGQSHQEEPLRQAIAAYQAAVERSPNSALARAQLAWVLHLGGDDQAATGQAGKALQLDALNPHEEFSLRKNRLIDPRQDEALWRMRRPETAEQTMQILRKS